MTETETSATPSPEIVRTFAVAPEIVFDAGEDIDCERTARACAGQYRGQ